MARAEQRFLVPAPTVHHANTATIRFGQVDVSQLLAAVRAAGYRPVVAETAIRFADMSCPAW